ncbi:MAG TPA: GNAT family N-acetyltransferase [Jatrophihabitans sp.]|nr:GNAT family N-acetyltransferase [Jatrophihabitans sp.]
MSPEWQPLTEADVQELSALLAVVARVDGTDELYQPEDLAEELAADGFDAGQDTVSVRVEGALVGWGSVTVSAGRFDGRGTAYLQGAVHPDHRGRGFGGQIMDFLEPRARRLGAERHPDTQLLLRASGGLPGASVRGLLARRGFEPVRYYHDMSLALPAQVELAGLPEVRSFTPELSEQTRLAHNEAFADHWGSTAMTPQRWAEFAGSRTLRPALSFVAVAEDGQVDGYAMIQEWVAGEAYASIVGVRRRARRRGLARACLGAAVRAAGEQGYRVIELSVDTQNAHGAGGLYTSLGFTTTKTVTGYGKVVPPL